MIPLRQPREAVGKLHAYTVDRTFTPPSTLEFIPVPRNDCSSQYALVCADWLISLPP